MQKSFSEILSHPSNLIFHVVFFPDRVYHAQYLNATRSGRYRYYVDEVRGKADTNVLKGRVFLDGALLSNFVRLEYKASRLVETARQRSRFLGSRVIAGVELEGFNGDRAQSYARMQLCPWIDAYQVEFWETLEPPPGRRHDHQVLDLMGFGGSIVHAPELDALLSDIKNIRRLRVWYRENDLTEHANYFISDQSASWDNSILGKPLVRPVRPEKV